MQGEFAMGLSQYGKSGNLIRHMIRTASVHVYFYTWIMQEKCVFHGSTQTSMIKWVITEIETYFLHKLFFCEVNLAGKLFAVLSLYLRSVYVFKTLIISDLYYRGGDLIGSKAPTNSIRSLSNWHFGCSKKGDPNCTIVRICLIYIETKSSSCPVPPSTTS